MSTIIHGWYSETAAERHGTAKYSTPDGVVVEVTMVTSVPERSDGYKDTRYVGKVTRWVGNGRPGKSTIGLFLNPWPMGRR